MLKLTKEVRDQWLADLRSGEFKQCRGTWNYIGEHCCLNLLWWRQTGKNFTDRHQTFRNEFQGFAVTFNGETADDYLIELNDEKRLTFPQIADWIEANLPAVEDQNA